MHNQRKNTRLKDYDYSQNNFYFITTNTYQLNKWLGEIKNGKIGLNGYGDVVKKSWIWLEYHYKYVILHSHVVMPDHFHGILEINSNKVNQNIKIKCLSELVGAFKTRSSKLIHEMGLLEFKWQRSFYENVIRNEGAFDNISEYIRYNKIKDTLIG